MAPRKIQMVWRDLNALGSAGPALHSTKHRYEQSALSKILSRFKIQKDAYGPYRHRSSPKAAHYGLRVEEFAEEGDRNGGTSGWHYFSLIRNKDDVSELDETPFVCPDGRDSLWDSATHMDIETIKNKALELIADAGSYRLFNNNCQNFAAALLLYIDPIHDSPYDLQTYLQKKKLVPVGDLGQDSVTFSSNNGRTLATVNDNEEFDRFFVERIHGHDAWEEVKKESRENPTMRRHLQIKGWTLPPAQ